VLYLHQSIWTPTVRLAAAAGARGACRLENPKNTRSDICVPPPRFEKEERRNEGEMITKELTDIRDEYRKIEKILKNVWQQAGSVADLSKVTSFGDEDVSQLTHGQKTGEDWDPHRAVQVPDPGGGEDWVRSSGRTATPPDGPPGRY